MISNKYECITNQKRTDAAALAPVDASFSLTRWQHCVAWNDVMTLIVKV